MVVEAGERERERDREKRRKKKERDREKRRKKKEERERGFAAAEVGHLQKTIPSLLRRNDEILTTAAAFSSSIAAVRAGRPLLSFF